MKKLKEMINVSNAEIKKIDKIISLLSALSNNIFFRYSDTTGCWAFPILKDDVGEEMNSWETKWCLPLYTFKDYPEQMRINEFTRIALNPIESIPHKIFYIFYPDLDQDTSKKILFPETMEELMDAYFNIQPEYTKIINNVINNLVNAVELFERKQTLSMICSFTSLETLISLEYCNDKPIHCEKCNQQQYSISKKFRDFLLKYVATSNSNKKKFNAYYSLRSKIIHTGESLKAETLFNEFSNAENDVEFITRIEILQISKLALANWLLINHRAKMQ